VYGKNPNVPEVPISYAMRSTHVRIGGSQDSSLSHHDSRRVGVVVVDLYGYHCICCGCG
jgi:hypothetical protein